jgi:hypothetical protein
MNTIFKEFTKTNDTKVSINVQRIFAFYPATPKVGVTTIDLGDNDCFYVKETYEQVKEMLSSNQ